MQGDSLHFDVLSAKDSTGVLRSFYPWVAEVLLKARLGLDPENQLLRTTGTLTAGHIEHSLCARHDGCCVQPQNP